jgi:hypothetical protein
MLIASAPHLQGYTMQICSYDGVPKQVRHDFLFNL